MTNIRRTPPSPRHLTASAGASFRGRQPTGQPARDGRVENYRGSPSFAGPPTVSLHPTIAGAYEPGRDLRVPATIGGEKCNLELRFKEEVRGDKSKLIAAILGTITMEVSVDIEDGECYHEGFQLTKSMQEGKSTYTVSMEVDKDDNVTRLRLTKETQEGVEELLSFGPSTADDEDASEVSDDRESSAPGGAAKHVRAEADTSEDEAPLLLRKRARIESTRQQSRFLAPAAMTAAYIQRNFHWKLSDMLTTDMFTSDPTEQQKQDNTYRTVWVLPMEKRFFAALLHTAYDACLAEQVDITDENTDVLLNQAVWALKSLRSGQKREINATLRRAHATSNDSNQALTLNKALTCLPARFASMSAISAHLARTVDRIGNANPDRRVDLKQWARLCIPGCTVDHLTRTLRFDADNPFLPYLQDSNAKSALLQWAKAWDYITSNADQGLSPGLLTNIWAILSGNSVPAEDGNHVLPDQNGNSTLLMEARPNTAQGTLTASGEADLMEKLESLAAQHGMTIGLGHSEDEKESDEYGRRVVTLERDAVEADVLNNMLATIVRNCKKKMDEASGDEEKLTAAQLRLAMDLTQWRVFPDENLTTGMMAVNMLRLQHGQSVPFTLPNPDILDGHSLSEILDIVRARGPQSW